MTCKIITKYNTVYVYDIKDHSEGLALAHILNNRLDKSNGKLKNNKIDGWKYYDTDYTYYAKARMNGDWEIRRVGN